MMLGWFWNFLVTAVSWSLYKSALFEVHSKVLNVFTFSGKCLLKVLAISSLFTSKVYFSITSSELFVIFSFSKRIMLESPWTCLLEKYGLTHSRKALNFLMSIYYQRTKFWISIKLNNQISLFLIFSNTILKFSSICFVFNFRVLDNGFTNGFLSTWGLWLPCRTLVFLTAWASKTFTSVFWKFL